MPITEKTARAELYRRATEEWGLLKKSHTDTWPRYATIGQAMVEAQTEIMRDRGLNAPVGPGYQKDIKAWLIEHKLDDMDKGVRSRLCELTEHKSEVDQMMSKWGVTEQMQWNHPNTVHRQWKAWQRKQGGPSPSGVKKLNKAKETNQQLAAQIEENTQLKAYVAELESAREIAPAEVQSGAGIGTLLKSLVERGIGESDVPGFAGAGLDPLDLLELAKWLKDLAGAWKADIKRQAKTKAKAKP